MRIGVNGYLAARGGGGIARHTRILLEALLAVEPDHQYVVFSDRPLPARFATDPRVESRVMRWPRYTIWEQVGLPPAMRRADLDLFFGPILGLPLLSPVPAVVMVHDLAYHRVAYTYPWKKRGYYQLFVGRSARMARRVLTPSHSAAEDVQAVLGIPADRIDVVHNALDPGFRPITDEAVLGRVRQRYALPERFILYVGTLEVRKNLERLVRAYAASRQEGRVDLPLVLAGGFGWGADRVRRVRESLGLDRDVLLTGYVADEDLPALYSAADLFVYPSLFEGFGLPPLEAMACGTPVITSTSSSLPEVVGDAALTVDPCDVSALADALGRALRDSGLRQHLRELGLRRADEYRFTPLAMAEGTLACFGRALAPSALPSSVPG